MAVASTKPKSQANREDKSCHSTQQLRKKRRIKSSGVRIVGGRIYDSQNGKTCHQCRQKTMDFMAPCKNQGEKKQCSLRFCHKCLSNRYGEKAEAAVALDGWKCPKCRGICNCSLCMKKRGHQPTGILVHTAKATGFSSASEMLQLKGSGNMGSGSSISDESTSLTASNEELVGDKAGGRRKRNDFDGKDDSRLLLKTLEMNGNTKETRNSKSKNIRKKDNENPCEHTRDDGPKSCPKKRRISKQVCKKEEMIHESMNKMNPDLPDKSSPEFIKIENKKARASKHATIENGKAKHKAVKKPYRCKTNILEVQSKISKVEILLPQGTPLNRVAAIDMPVQDIGHGLQFLEFCEAFGQALDLKKGQPEQLLRELISGQSKHRRQNHLVVRFHIQLLSIIRKDSEKNYPPLDPNGRGNSWLKALTRCISESNFPPKELQLDCSDMGGHGYNKLDSSQKLRLLNFLCDEALGTVELRNWIDVQSSKFVERKRKEKGKCLAREKNIKKKLQDEMVKALLMKNGAPLSISEYDDLVAKIKAEVSQTLAGAVETLDYKMRQQCDAVRSEAILLDGSCRKFWRLSCYSSDMDILLQDVGNGDSFISGERWFTYHVEQKATVEKYISSLRQLRR